MGQGGGKGRRVVLPQSGGRDVGGGGGRGELNGSSAYIRAQHRPTSGNRSSRS